MPVPIIPVLGVIGRFVAARGLKKGIQKYGKKKAKEAQKQIEKQKEELAKKAKEAADKIGREAEITRKAELAKEARIAQGASRYGKQSQIRSAETRKVQARKVREPKKDPEYYLKEYPEGIPLKFSKGGLVTFKDISKMK